ncbi:MAG: hypothetical protein AAFW84_31295 [Cyanobacteria bacterium J06635_15]
MSDIENAISTCSTSWLRNLLRKELPKVLGVEDTPAGHQQAQAFDALVKAKMAARGLVSLRQQKNPITDVRRVIKAIDPNHPALADVGFSKAEWTDINLPAEEAVAGRVAKPIENPDEIATEMGTTPSKIVKDAIGQYLGKTDPDSVALMARRLNKLEQQYKKLAQLV